MIDIELYHQAVIRVKSGQTISSVIETLYRNRRGYREKTNTLQRSELSRCRVEYLALANQDKPRNKYPRLFIETTQELRTSVEEHCKKEGITIAQFANNAIRQALRIAQKKG